MSSKYNKLQGDEEMVSIDAIDASVKAAERLPDIWVLRFVPIVNNPNTFHWTTAPLTEYIQSEEEVFREKNSHFLLITSCYTEQDWHSTDPAAEKLSASQSVHTEAPPEEYLPGGHAKQTVEPLLGL